MTENKPTEAILEDEDDLYRDAEHPGKARVHVFRNMNDEIMERCMSVILGYINQSLSDGSLSRMLDVSLKTERVTGQEIHITGIQHYDTAREEMESDVRFWLKLQYMDTGKVCDGEYDLGITLYKSFKDSRITEVLSLWDVSEAPVRDGCAVMDNYLNLCLSREQKENRGDWMWLRYTKDGLTNATRRTPEHLLEGMGLEMRLVAWENEPEVMVCFAGSTVMLPSDSGVVPTVLKADTLIVSVNQKGERIPDDLELYRHLARYELQYKMLKFNRLETDDLSAVRMEWLPLEDAANMASVFRWIESVPSRVAFSLLLPKEYLQGYIRDNQGRVSGIKRFYNYPNHEAFRLQEIGKQLNHDFPALSRKCIKARLIQIGLHQARGIFHYTDFHMMDAFATTSERMTGGEFTVAIGTRARMLSLFYREPYFREIMETGEFVFADGLIVRNMPLAVMDTARGARPTPEVNDNADRYSLWFSQKWLPKSARYVFRFGKENYEMAAGMVSGGSQYDGKVRESREAQIQRLREFTSFHKVLADLIHTRTTVEKVSAASAISVKRLTELCREEQTTYHLDEVIALCLGLKLEPYLSYVLMEKARVSFQEDENGWDPDYRRGLLCCCFRDSVSEVIRWIEDQKKQRYGLEIGELVLADGSTHNVHNI